MGCYVLGFQEIDQTQVAVVGGKGAHLGELSRIEGLRVPAGFCVTKDAFRRIMAEAPSIDDRLDRLSRLKPDDREAIRALSAEIRRTLEGIAIPDDLAAAITRPLARLGEQAAYAVRSSATAEDLPTASFAGQQDTYLNVVGPAAILQHVSRCWASLFTERAVTYRLRNGLDHRKVHMAVVVQRMVFPQAAGILFSADPITGNRKVTSVEASFGLGEALVSGLVNADVYKVRDGEVVAKAVATKQLAIPASPAGGTQEQAIEPERQEQPALTDAQVVRLAQLGRRIEAHFGCPQDIEWCLVDDGFQFVQSRPITTLFPIPDVTLSGTDCVSVSAAFFSPSHACSRSLSHQVASIAAMITCMLRGSNRIRFSSWMSARMKSSSADPDFVGMSRFKAAMEAWLRPISSATMAGSVSIGAGAPPAGAPPGLASGSDRMKSPRSRMVCSASLISGSDFPRTSRRPARLAGEARPRVTSTNSLPPSSYMGRPAVSCHRESPRGFMASVIIC
ncbi:MAG TPA: PEP/pyruvate-binding domain-containing protein [Rubrobacteraceae bacterium]|nr:PEP/pyruvate-binding domain-containing protein [Rubrobacteraceae bacterium]